MYSEDLLVIIYPNLGNIKGIVIVDPLDKRVLYKSVDSVDEAKEFLRDNLPFCSQDHPPEIHLGSAVVMEWEGLPDSNVEIHKPEDIDKVLS